jgi:hypothetical protein
MANVDAIPGERRFVPEFSVGAMRAMASAASSERQLRSSCWGDAARRRAPYPTFLQRCFSAEHSPIARMLLRTK